MYCMNRVCDSGILDDHPDARPPPPKSGVELAWRRELQDLEARLLQSFTSSQEHLRKLCETKVSHDELQGSMAMLRLQLEPLATQQGALVNTQSEQQRAFEELAARVDNTQSEQHRVFEELAARVDIDSGLPSKEAAIVQSPSEEDAKQLRLALSEEQQNVSDLKSKVQMLSDSINDKTQKYAEVEAKVVMLESQVWNGVNVTGEPEEVAGTPDEFKVVEGDHRGTEVYAYANDMFDPIIKQDAPTEKNNESIIAGMPEASRELAGSIWEAAILFGMPRVPHIANVLIVIGFLFNAMCQCLFCIIIDSQFLDPTIPGRDQLQDWRISAHDIDQVDPNTGASLVARLCGRDNSLQLASKQYSVLDAYDNYLPSIPLPPPLDDLPTGPTLFLLSWGLWFMCAFDETSQAISFLLAVWHLPRGAHAQMDVTADSYKLTEMSIPRRCFVVLITSVRVSISVSLGLIGSLWLANQLEVEDLVLNAAALGFVMDLDEFVFGVFMPAIIHTMVGNMEPLVFKRHPHPILHYFLDIIGVRPFVGCVVAIAAIRRLLTTRIKENVNHLTDLEDVLCGGNKDFTTSLNYGTGLLLARRTEPYNADVQNSISKRLEAGFRDLRALTKNTIEEEIFNFTAYLTPNVATFKQFQESTMEEHAYNIGYAMTECDSDSMNNFMGKFPPYIINGLRFLSGIQNATGCKDLRPVCHLKGNSFIRVFCPTQCGCDSPLSGLFYGGPAMGCPRDKCEQSRYYVQVMDTTKCADPTAAQLRKKEGWNIYWDQFAEVEDFANGGSWRFDERELNSTGTAELVKKGGCEIIRQFTQLTYSFCFQTPQTNSLVTFCPETCGCRSQPDLPGCPSDCRRYENEYLAALKNLPCADTPVGFLEVSKIPIRQFQISAYLNYHSYWKSNALESYAGLESFFQLHAAINASGCKPDMRISARIQKLSDLCSNVWVSLDVQPFCPQMCNCSDSGSIGCPPKCAKPTTLEQVMQMEAASAEQVVHGTVSR